MNTKHVLIVDDDPNNAVMVRDMLAFLGDDYVFEIAYQGDEALAKIEETSYDLVITDYFMPGLTGMNLIDKIRDISPHTKLVLMTAEGSNRLVRVAKYRSVDHYIKKPFSIKKMREVVQLALAEGATQAEVEDSQDESRSQDESPQDERPPQDEHPSQDESPQDDDISEELKALKAKTGVYSVLLVSSDGYPVDVAGEIAQLDVTSASALIAASFSASSQLAKLFGHRHSSFKSTYYEGDEYSIYSYGINTKMLLAIVSDTQIKPGLVSYYAKQTISNLVPLLAQEAAPLSWEELQVDEEMIGEQLDELFKMKI